jgi:hypothetical protein
VSLLVLLLGLVGQRRLRLFVSTPLKTKLCNSRKSTTHKTIPIYSGPFDNPIKKEKRPTAYDIPHALGLPFRWYEGTRDPHVEHCSDHKDLTKEVDFVRRCLVPEMEVSF